MTASFRDTIARGRMVLIVDDDVVSAEGLAHAIGGYGYRTMVASNGEDALLHCIATQPAAVVLDIQMPRMSGLELTRRLRSTPGLAQVLVIAVTAHERAEVKTFARQAGIDKLIFKPLRRQEMEGIAAAILEAEHRLDAIRVTN